MERHPLILHVGLQKTGTSSIQLMLSGSAATLSEAGYHYPDLPGPRGGVRSSPFRHNILAGTYADFHSVFDKLTPDEEETFWSGVRHAPTAAILSAEEFSRQRDFGPMAARMQTLEVRPVIYLRRQDLFVESLYNQRNKLLLMRDDPSLLDPDLLGEPALFAFIKASNYTQVLNFERLIRAMEDRFRGPPPVVRLFDRATLTEGDVCQDFAEAVGLPRAAMTIPRAAANESVPNAALEEILAVLRTRGEGPAKQKMREIREALKAGTLARGGYRILTDGTRRNLLGQYAGINRFVADRFGVTIR